MPWCGRPVHVCFYRAKNCNFLISGGYLIPGLVQPITISAYFTGKPGIVSVMIGLAEIGF